MARRCWSCTNSIPRRKLSTVPSPGWRVGCPRRSRNWTSFSSPWARAWDGHEVVDLAAGRLALHYAEENPDEVVAALCGPTRPSSTSLATRPNRGGLVVRVRLDPPFCALFYAGALPPPEPTLHRPESGRRSACDAEIENAS